MRQLIGIAVVAGTLAVSAQVDALQSVGPSPVVDGDVTAAQVNGVMVLVKRIPGAELVTTDLYVLGGVRNWPQEQAGIELLALKTSVGGGTTTLNKEAFARRLKSLGGTIEVYATGDFTVMTGKTLREHWEQTFDLETDAFLNPALPASEIEVQRRQLLSALQHEEEDPDSRLWKAIHQAVYDGTSYSNRAQGTPEAVAKLTAAQLRDHLAGLRQAGRLMVIVVGNVNANDVLSRVRADLGTLPTGSFRFSPISRPPVLPARVVRRDLTLPTNYIASGFVGPTWADADLPAAIVTMRLLRDRVWEEVRTKRNLSYAPGAWIRVAVDGLSQGAISVSAVDPKTTMGVMAHEVARLRNEPVPTKEIVGSRAQAATDFLVHNQQLDLQSLFLADAQLFGGNWRLARRMADSMKKVSAGDVQSFAKKYLRNLQTVYIGNVNTFDEAALTIQ